MRFALSILLSGLAYALVVHFFIIFGARICKDVAVFDDAPPTVIPPTRWILTGAALLGSLLAFHHAPVGSIAVYALVVGCLAACWYCDCLRAILPDVFTLVPLAMLLILALARHDLSPFVAAAAIFVPFALAAFFSGGIGMGWGDVKLAALGGAALGLQNSFMATICACLLAASIAKYRRRTKEPMLFAPYLVVAFGCSLGLA